MATDDASPADTPPQEARDTAGDRAAPSRSREEDVPDQPEKHTQQRLLASIGGLYALAQALTPSERAARRLVEATYARAAEALDTREAPPSGTTDPRPWLYKLLVRTARERPDNAGSGEARSGEDAAAPGDAGTDRHFRHRAQERFLRRALPPAFAALSPTQRLLLTLCDIEQLSEGEAADVAALSPEDTDRQLARARADLRDALRQMAPRPERPFLEEEVLSDAHLKAALGRMAKRDLTAPPPALRPAARQALRHEHQASSPPPAAPRPSEERPDRPSEEASGTTWRQKFPRLAVAMLLIGLAGGLGYLTTAVLDRPGETDLVALSVQKAPGVDARLRTESAERAEQFVRDELGRRLTVPHIEGARLRGVGVTEVIPGERVPVFLFRDSASGRPVTAYAYDYALLDRAEEALRLPAGLRQQLAEEGRFASQDVEGRRVLLWRHRDDIFAAVTTRDDSLQQRIAL